MRKKILVNTKHLEQLLRDTLIPLARNGTTIHLFDTPPRSTSRIEIEGYDTSPLRKYEKVKPYPGYHCWPEEDVNSIEVPVLGCVYQGQFDYAVRTPPGMAGKRWVVPVKEGAFFVVRPGIPFTAGKIMNSSMEYVRGFLFHLRRDGVNFRSFTIDKNNLWQPLHFFFPDPGPHLLGERLLHELQVTDRFSLTIVYHYLLLILLLIQRNIENQKFFSIGEDRDLLRPGESEWPVSKVEASDEKIYAAVNYIHEHLDDPQLTCGQIATYTGISERHLHRLFRQVTNYSLFQFIQQQRLERACELLENSVLPVQLVGKYCGFPDFSHFCTWFKKHQRCSPGKYRIHGEING